LAGLHALKSTPLVTTRWRPSTFHAKAYLRTEETRNLNIPFGESSPFRAGRMSMPGDDTGPMTDDAGARAHVEPHEAFGLLSNETRVAILRALDDAPVGTPASFSDLYDAVDYGDSAGFNYHLSKLVPQFVRKAGDGADADGTDGDGDEDEGGRGYALTAAGERVVRAIEAGIYTDAATVPSTPVAGDCRSCGAAALRGSYADEEVRIDCAACGDRHLEVDAPPSVVVGREPDEAMAAFDRWSRASVDQALAGVCPDCGGAVERSIDGTPPDALRADAVAWIDCAVCGRTVVTSFGALASRLDAVREFHRERGVDLAERPYWAVPQCLGEHTAVLDRSPWRVRVRFPLDGDACTVTFDAGLEPVDVDVRAGDDA
jgi:hypothetical protein